MTRPRLIVLRGKPTSGKSTAFHVLKKDKRMSSFVFIDFPAMKNMFDNLGDEYRKKIGKELLSCALRYLMPLRRDIILEEMSRESLLSLVGKEFKQHRYQFVIFQFEVSLDSAYKRNIKRARDKWHPLMTRRQLEDFHKLHEVKFDKKGFLVDCDKLNKKQVVEFIIKKLKQRKP